MWQNLMNKSKLERREVTERLKDALVASMGETRSDPVPYPEMYFRSSGIGGFCIRKHCLAMLFNEKLDAKGIDYKARWIFGIGTAYHYEFQNDYLLSLGNLLQGYWRCRVCGHVHKGEEVEGSYYGHKWIPKPDKCEKCEASTSMLEYEEITFMDEDRNAGGHPDGILVWSQEDEELLELKTINSLAYVDPVVGGSPKEEHVIQMNMYMYFTGFKRGRLVYILKGENDIRKALVEHVVDFDESLVEEKFKMLSDGRDSMSVLQKKMHELGVFPATGGFTGVTFTKNAKGFRAIPEELKVLLPERCSQCQKKTDYKAKYCSRKKECFAL